LTLLVVCDLVLAYNNLLLIGGVLGALLLDLASARGLVHLMVAQCRATIALAQLAPSSQVQDRLLLYVRVDRALSVNLFNFFIDVFKFFIFLEDEV
jgi:hypothetical protein